MIKQHAKRMERAEKCCAALREWMAVALSAPIERQEIFDELYKRLVSWMRVAPKKVVYQRTKRTTVR